MTTKRSSVAIEWAVTILSIALTAVATGAAVNYFEENRELQVGLRDQKAKRYQRLIRLLDDGFIDHTSSRQFRQRAKAEYYEELYVLWLYASDDVILNLNGFTRAWAAYTADDGVGDKIEPDEKRRRGEAMRNARRDAVLAMRRDIRGSTSLAKEDFITVKVTDPEEPPPNSAHNPTLSPEPHGPNW